MTNISPPPQTPQNPPGGGKEAYELAAHTARLRREFPWHVSHNQTYCIVLETEAQLERLAPLWRAFYDADLAASPVASWEWMWHWWQCFGKHPRDGASAFRPYVVAVLSDAHELIGLFPFHYPVYHAALGLGRTASPRPLRAFGSLGRHREAMTEEPILLTKPGQMRRALESVLHFLLRQQPQFAWDLIDCWVQHSEAVPMAASRASCSPWQAHLQHRRQSPVMKIVLPPSWEALRGSLSKSMRDNLRYYPNLLARHGHTWDVSVAATGDEVAQEVDSLVALHRRREETRTGEKVGGHLPSAAHRRFLQDTLPTLAAHGTASIAVLRVDGRRAAAQMLLRRGKECIFYYSGFDPDWGAYSPLTILHAEVFAGLAGSGVTGVNLLAGEAQWKTRWGAQRSGTLQQLSYVRSRPTSLARLLLYAHQKKMTRDVIEGTGE